MSAEEIRAGKYFKSCVNKGVALLVIKKKKQTNKNNNNNNNNNIVQWLRPCLHGGMVLRLTGLPG